MTKLYNNFTYQRGRHNGLAQVSPLRGQHFVKRVPDPMSCDELR